MTEIQPPLVLGEKVWCQHCRQYVKVIRVSGAAKIVDVDRRTIYNYIKQQKVFAVKIAGNTIRVCSNCLLRQKEDEPANDSHGANGSSR